MTHAAEERPGRRGPRILIVAYRFPPQGGGGVQRPAKLAKFWSRSGAPVAVLSGPVSQPSTQDTSLLEDIPADVDRFRVGDPNPLHALHAMRQRLSGRGVSRVADRLLVAMSRGIHELSLPDDYCSWCLTACARGLTLARRFRPDLVFVTGPPFTPFLVGGYLSSALRKPLVLDYRDPWSASYLPSSEPWLRSRFNPALERWSIGRSAAIVAAHRAVLTELRLRFPQALSRAGRRLWVPNGFDPEDFVADTAPADGPFTLSYSGSFYGFRNPRTLLEVVEELLQEGTIDASRFRFLVSGVTARNAAQDERYERLSSVLELKGYVPHRESVRQMQRATVNLVFEGLTGEANVHSPGKLYEVLNAGRPVLLVCPEGVTTRLARRVGGCRIVHPEDRPAIRESIVAMYRDWADGGPQTVPDGKALGFYRRSHQAARLLAFLERVRSDAAGPKPAAPGA